MKMKVYSNESKPERYVFISFTISFADNQMLIANDRDEIKYMARKGVKRILI